MAMWADWINDLRKKQEVEINQMLKADGDSLPDNSESTIDENKIGRQSIVEDPFFEPASYQNIYKMKSSRLSNKMLKDSSLRDWLVSAILQIRVDTLQRFSRPQTRKHNPGFRVVKIGDLEVDYSPEEKEEIAKIESFITNCGRVEGTPEDDKLLFSDFLRLIVRDALTFGYTAVEKIQTRNGGLHRFRPVPAEQTYLVNKETSRATILQEIKAIKPFLAPKSDNDPQTEEEYYEAMVKYFKYVQVTYDNRTLGIFGDEDMIFKLFNPQNFADSMGYCYGPLELAILNVKNHLNTENYNANFFTHGYAAKGLLHLKGTVTQSQLTNFRRQFYNTISGSANAWRTPIIAGLDDVQWVPMAGSSKEMEYINYNNHLMRSICSQFQIDPIELGLDTISSSTGRASGNESSTVQKIEYSRERGLYPILMYIEDMMNCNIIPALDKELSKKYVFKFDGYSDVTPQTEAALLQAEMTIHSSMNDLLRSARKEQFDEAIGELPMNPQFWAFVEKNYTRGEIREKFLKDKGAASRPELQYIPGDPMFINWQQMLMTIQAQKKAEEAQKAEAEAQSQGQEEDKAMEHKRLEHEEATHQREEEKHHAENEQREDAKAHAVMQNLQDTAKQYGASGATHAGGTIVANPINTLANL